MNIVLLFIIVGLSLLVSFFVIIIKLKKINSHKSIPKDLMHRWDKLKIKLEDCEIKSNVYNENNTEYNIPSSMEILDSIYHPTKEQKREIKTVSIILYKHKFLDGQIIEYKSEPIYSPIENIRLWLINREEANLFIDPNNRYNYYFEI